MANLCMACSQPADDPFPLQDAAAQNAARWIKRFKEAGHDPRLADDMGITPLHVAATVGIGHQLIALGAEVNAVASDGATPLHAAVMFERTSLTKLLLKHGADVEAADSHGWRALHYAAASNDPKHVRMLIKAGATRDARTSEGYTPTDIAYRFNNPRSIAALER